MELAANGNAIEKAKAFNDVVETLFAEIRKARKEAIQEATTLMQDHMNRLQCLELALASCGYTRGATG